MPASIKTIAAFIGFVMVYRVAGQAPSVESPVSVCEALEAHQKYNGQMIVVSGFYEDWAHGARLRGEGCDGKLVIQDRSWTWQPVIELTTRKEFYEKRGLDFNRLTSALTRLGAAFRRELRKNPGQTPKGYQVTFKGIFHADKNMLLSAGVGLGALNAAPAELFIDDLISVEAVWN